MTHAADPSNGGRDSSGRRPAAPDYADYPVRDYVATMSVELAQMARWDGDERLACVLEAVAAMAREPR